MSYETTTVSVDAGAATGMLILFVVLGLACFVGFILGIIATIKCATSGHSKLFGVHYWIHILIALCIPPVELIFGSIEISYQNNLPHSSTTKNSTA